MSVRGYFSTEEEYEKVRGIVSNHGSIIVTGSDQTRFDFVLSLKAEMEAAASLSFVLLDNEEGKEAVPPSLPTFRFEPARLIRQIPAYYEKGFSSFILNARDCSDVRQIFAISGFLGPDNIFSFHAASPDSFRKKLTKCTSPLPLSYIATTFPFFVHITDASASVITI